jgi:Fic family protein
LPRPSRRVIYERLDQAVADLEAIGGLQTPQEARSIWADIWYEEAHHSTAMEGNTLIEREVQLLLFSGRAYGGKELKAYLEVKGYADAAEWVYAQAKAPAGDWAVSQTELREIHRRVVQPVWQFFPPDDLHPRDAPGEFRHGEVEPLRPGFKPPDSTDVRPQVSDWLVRARRLSEDAVPEGAHIIEDFAAVHADFERIHPFPDGNGRTGRLVLNLLLVKSGYPPAVIHKQERNKYLDGLKRADDGDPGLLGEVLARSVKHGIDRFLIPGLAGPHRFVPLVTLSEATGLSRNALLLAAQRGRLEATFRNGQWYSSRQCVDDYKASRYKRAS